jgi:serine/threonine-protein kinase
VAVEPGEQLSHYRLIEKIGEGGMGVVYKARDQKLRRDVALKVLPGHLVGDARRRLRFMQEARAAAAVTHTNIATVYEVDEAEGVLFIAMELVEGQTLRRRLGGSALPIPDALSIAGGIADGLARAHAAGVVHRDLKPENVVIESDDHVKLLDFGLAKVVQERKEGPHPSSSQAETTTVGELTVEQSLMGTPTYMSPEQARGEVVDTRSDVFSFGSTLYEMVTGKPPFRGRTFMETLGAVMHAQPTPASQLNPRVPPDLERILEKCLQKDPQQRYQDTRELAAELQTLRRSGARPSRLWGRLALAGALVVLVALVALWVRFKPSVAPSGPRIASLAVLPFASHASEPGKEYLADAMTDLMIATLGSVEELRVIGRFSSMAYKDTSLTREEIGRELNVEALVEGSVMWAGEDFRITVQLIDVETVEQLWARSYQGDLSNILTLQGEVATAIADEIQLTLTPQEQARLRPTRQVDPRAYELYLMGKQLRDRQTPEDWRKAQDFFERAIAIDSTLAEAHAGLARVYGLLAGKDLLPKAETVPKIRAAVRKALELDDMLAEAHGQWALILLWLDWDWPAAEAASRRALELNPNSAEVRQAHAWSLILSGRTDEALHQLEVAREAEPWVEGFMETHAYFLYLAGRHERALELLRRGIDFKPEHPRWYFVRGLIYTHLGDFQQAIEQYRQIRREARMLSDERASLGYAYARAGRTAEAERILDELREESERGEVQVQSYHLAMIAHGLGDEDQAFELLEQAYEHHDVVLPVIAVDPIWDSLRSDPQFDDLIARMGLTVH